MDTNSIATTVDLYFEAWNSHGVANIKTLLEKCLTADCEYKTQTGIFYGIDAIAAVIENNNVEVPGRKFRLCSNIEVHNDVARYNWQLIPPNEAGLTGTDVFEFNAETKMAKIIGFYPELIAI
jgi:hypothetical protein